MCCFPPHYACPLNNLSTHLIYSFLPRVHHTIAAWLASLASCNPESPTVSRARWTMHAGVQKPRFWFFNYYLFIFGCSGSLLLPVGFLRLQCTGFSLLWLLLLWSTGSRAQAPKSWHTGLSAPWHVRSSWTGNRTCVPCIGR